MDALHGVASPLQATSQIAQRVAGFWRITRIRFYMGCRVNGYSRLHHHQHFLGGQKMRRRSVQPAQLIALKLSGITLQHILGFLQQLGRGALSGTGMDVVMASIRNQ